MIQPQAPTIPGEIERSRYEWYCRLGIGHFNIETGKIDQPLLCGGGEGVAKTIGTQAPFELTSDETVALSSGENLLIGIRCDTVPACINAKIGFTPRQRYAAGRQCSCCQ